MKKPKAEPIHPTATKCHKLGEMFLKIATKHPKAEVDMGAAEWDNSCKSPACHAGWFAVANKEKLTESFRWADSAHQMADFLGFNSKSNLEDWAGNNPKIWGNQYGSDMFYEKEAFTGKRPANRFLQAHKPVPFSLKIVGQHWLKVAVRLRSKSSRFKAHTQK